MSFKADTRGAYRAGKRFKAMAGRMPKAEELAAADLQRRLVPEFVRAAREAYGILPKRVRESSAARRQGAAVELTGYDRPTGLLQFGGKGSTAGVTALIQRARGPTLFRHAFIATGLSGNRQVFERVAYGAGAYKRQMRRGNYIGERRTPIEAKYGPSVAQILRNKQLQERLIDFSQQRIAAEIRRVLGSL